MKNKALTLELPNFQGPLDLLLHLIRQQKINIYDIPIAKITSQYLTYLRKMQDLNLQIAGEYFVMSATLLRIKSQLLLPQNHFAENQEEDDPRQELVEQLVQYSVFKKISAYLKERQQRLPLLVAKEASGERGQVISPLPAGVISATDLKTALIAVLRKWRWRHPQPATVNLRETPVKGMMTYLQRKLQQEQKVSFFSCLRDLHGLSDLLALFLAMLELAEKQKVIIRQKESFADIEVEQQTKND